MIQWVRRALLPLLILALLCGCAAPGLPAPAQQATQTTATQEPDAPKATVPQRILNSERTFSQMEYDRPDIETIEEERLAVLAAAYGGDTQAAMDALDQYFDSYDWYYTYYWISDIRYSAHLSDTYWEEEYNFFLDTSAQIDEGLEGLYYDLAASPCCAALEEEYFYEGFFDDYQGENLWGAEFTALLEQENELIGTYYTLSAEDSDASFEEIAQLLCDLIRVRQEIAHYWGYDNYVDYANETIFYRDYGRGQMEAFLQDIVRELVPLFRRLPETNVWDAYWTECSQEEMVDFLRETAQNMGNVPQKAFREMTKRELCDLGYSEDKFDISFEVYLTSYEVPYLFLNPMGTEYDKMTLLHEFGHFCNDYAAKGSYASTDVLEIFSQAMEYLSLSYGPASPALAKMKLADSLSTYVEQAMYASFELKAYSLSDEELTVDSLCSLFEDACKEFSLADLGFDRREFVLIPHFYVQPIYVFSYVISNDAAMQIYLLELEEEGAGLSCYMDQLGSQESFILTFLEDAGLRNPFDGETLRDVRQLLKKEIFA